MIANFILSTLLMAVTAAPSGEIPARAAATHDFSRYQIILDRSPFSPPAGSVVEVQPSFAARYTFIGTYRLDETKPLVAAIQDKEAANRIYWKVEGETIGAATVVSIGQSPGAKLVLKQSLETATLTMETKAGVGAAPPAPTPGAAPPLPGQPVPQGVRRIPFRRGE